MTYTLDTLTFPLKGTRLIEASAGTGKTYTIAALYLRLVLGHGEEQGFGRPLTPPEILVVTFTQAATEELRERIRSRLTEAADFFRGRIKGDDFLEGLGEGYDRESRPKCATLLEQAAQWMDEAAIHTIHAWCRRMLRQHAFESGSLFDLELAPDDRDLQEEAARDYWRCHLYSRPPELLARLLEEVKIKTPLELLDRVRPFMGVDLDAGPDPFELLEKRLAAVEEARLAWEEDFDTAVKQVREARADKSLNGNKYRPASLEKWLDQVSSWVLQKGPLPDTQALEKLSRQGLAAGVSKKGVPPEHSAYDALDRLLEGLEEVDIETAFLCHGAKEIRERMIREKNRLARIGFDDLLTRLGEALKPPRGEDLARTIRSQFPVAMIDEFQDTDPVQYAAFGHIYLGEDDTGFFMIGDPKQAIYAFRGADIHTYLTARRDAVDALYTLDRNYRSTEGVVEAVNQLFSAADGYSEGPFLFKEDIPFEKVKARGREERLLVEGEPVPGMTIWQMEQTGPVKKTGEGGYIDSMAAAGAGEITRILNLGGEMPPRAGFQEPDGSMTPLGPSDIAVLVRNGSEAGAIRKALDNLGVRSVYLSDKESVFDTEEARSILYLLLACLEPGDDQRIRVALSTSILGLPLEELDLLNRDEAAWEREVVRFRELKSIWQDRGVLPMLRRLFREFEVAERLMARSSGERVLTNLLHLSEMLQTASARLDGDQALIRWLARQIMEPGDLGEEQILRLESDDDLVRVVTIHKSKGLEYPLVFLPFICSVRRVTSKNSPVLFLPEKGGGRRLVQKPGEAEFDAADRERLAEDLRMLYVAVTRARHACWLGVAAMGRVTKKEGEKTELHQSGLGYLLSGGKMIPTLELPDRLESIRGESRDIKIAPLPEHGMERYQPKGAGEELLPARIFEGRVHSPWWITSYSGILAGASMAEPVVSAGDMGESHQEAAFDFNGPGASMVVPESPDSAAQDQLQEAAASEIPSTDTKIRPWARSIHTFPRGPEPGTFLHDLLEWAAQEGFDSLDKDEVQARIHETAVSRGWEEWETMLFDWLTALIETPLNLGCGDMKMAQLPKEACRAELEFMFAAHGVDTGRLDSLVTEKILAGTLRPRLREDIINGMLKGFIDLVFCRHGRYYVLDYKSNHLGEESAAYGAEAMAHAMLEHRYDLQYVLYTLALHRLLKSRLPDYDYERDVGGAVYLFLRGVDHDGHGVYTDKPPWTLIRTLDTLFAGDE